MPRRMFLLLLLGLPVLGCSPGDVLSPFQSQPAVSITVASAIGRPWHNTVEWRVKNGSVAPYLIERCYVGEPWKPMVHLSIEGEHLILEDYAAMPGATYAYRVVLGETRASGTAGEVTVRTPK